MFLTIVYIYLLGTAGCVKRVKWVDISCEYNAKPAKAKPANAKPANTKPILVCWFAEKVIYVHLKLIFMKIIFNKQVELNEAITNKYSLWT